jgi:hypothetical protein
MKVNQRISTVLCMIVSQCCESGSRLILTFLVGSNSGSGFGPGSNSGFGPGSKFGCLLTDPFPDLYLFEAVKPRLVYSVQYALQYVLLKMHFVICLLATVFVAYD